MQHHVYTHTQTPKQHGRRHLKQRQATQEIQRTKKPHNLPKRKDCSEQKDPPTQVQKTVSLFGSYSEYFPVPILHSQLFLNPNQNSQTRNAVFILYLLLFQDG